MPARLIIKAVFILLMVSSSCIDRYNPSFDKYENLLVVDGYFTDEEKIHSIKLTTASSIYSRQFLPVEGAEVSIESETGDVFYFYENIPGNYHSYNSIKGVPGKSYKLKVTIDNTNYYETEFQELIAAPPVDSLYTKRETRNTTEIGEVIDGLQFFIDATKVDEKNDYFQWKLTETYEYDSDYLLESYYAGGIFNFRDKDSLFTCWKTAELSTIYTHSAKYSEGDKIKKYPLNYVGNDSKSLSKRYSLFVKQYALNEDAYNYWNSLKEQFDNQGGLYSKQPFQINGNLRNLDLPDEVVLGYFTVAGTSEKRIFVDKPDDMNVRNENCEINTDMMDLISQAPSGMWPFFLIYNKNGELGVVDEACVNCEMHEGEINKPDFWE